MPGKIFRMCGTINGKSGAEFAKYQRSLVEEFLGWQAAIVSEYKEKTSLSLTIWILSGEDIPTACSRM